MGSSGALSAVPPALSDSAATEIGLTLACASVDEANMESAQSMDTVKDQEENRGLVEASFLRDVLEGNSCGGLKFPEDFYTIVCVQGEKQDQSSIL